ncbi:DUF5908 family protein [Chitinophaga sp.]|uniref:DUF5908 family protein n=1 Tax=Chitinophaga sp. TaxID=1869181 RepID=UPI00261F09C2|nr:DUF5908 family protein [uncultured Chitinophaga sp.]
MPIEIRELVIRARVEEPAAQQSGPAGPAASAGNAPPQQDIQQIVAICTEEVMKLLKKQNDR